MTQLTMRTAKPLDVVNLYRLLSKQGEYGPLDRPDEARALAFVLDLIAHGYVLVAENSAGRIVGTLGCAASRIRGKLVAVGQWLAVLPPFQRTAPLDLLDMTVRAADHAGFAVRFPLSLPVDQSVMKNLGFRKTKTEWTRSSKKKKNVPQESVEETQGEAPQVG